MIDYAFPCELWGGPKDGDVLMATQTFLVLSRPSLTMQEMMKRPLDEPLSLDEGVYRHEGTVRADGTYVLVWQGWQ